MKKNFFYHLPNQVSNNYQTKEMRDSEKNIKRRTKGKRKLRLDNKCQKLTRSGKCEPIETNRPAAALCQSAFSSYLNKKKKKKNNSFYVGFPLVEQVMHNKNTRSKK